MIDAMLFEEWSEDWVNVIVVVVFVVFAVFVVFVFVYDFHVYYLSLAFGLKFVTGWTINLLPF